MGGDSSRIAHPNASHRRAAHKIAMVLPGKSGKVVLQINRAGINGRGLRIVPVGEDTFQRLSEGFLHPIELETLHLILIKKPPANVRRGPIGHDVVDRKSTRLNSSHVAISYA